VNIVYISGQYYMSEGAWLKFNRQFFFVGNDTAVENSIITNMINSLNAELNSICHLLALLGAHPILHVSRIRVKLLQD
jgi:hypothetical protein